MFRPSSVLSSGNILCADPLTILLIGAGSGSRWRHTLKKMKFWGGVICIWRQRFWLALEDIILVVHGMQWHKLLSQSPVVTRNGEPWRQCFWEVGGYYHRPVWRTWAIWELELTSCFNYMEELEQSYKLKGFTCFVQDMIREPGTFCDTKNILPSAPNSIDIQKSDPSWSCGLLNSNRHPTSPGFLDKSGTFI